MMVANVSRVLETDADVLTSTVQPGKASNPDRGCLNFVTARHALDPFTIPRMFDPEEWPDAETVQQGRYRSLRVNHFRARNIHGLKHYLRHPAVHIPLMRLLADQKSVISVAEENKALKEFTDFGDVPTEMAKAELKRLELMQPARSDNWTISPLHLGRILRRITPRPRGYDICEHEASRAAGAQRCSDPRSVACRSAIV